MEGTKDMTSPFEAAGFTTYRLPQIPQAQAPQTNPAATAPVAQPAAAPAPSVSVPSAPLNNTEADTFTPSAPIDRDALKEEIRQEIINEMKTQQELENKAKAAEEKKKNKLGPIKRLKRFIGNIKKAFVTAGEYVAGFFRGTVKGGIIGGAVGGAVYGVGSILKDPAKLTQTPVVGKLFRGTKLVTNADTIKNSFVTKLLSNKTTAIAAGGVVLAIGLIGAMWNASIRANEKRALIEHKYESTPTIRK